jgi:hypothetical protein
MVCIIKLKEKTYGVGEGAGVGWGTDWVIVTTA